MYICYVINHVIKTKKMAPVKLELKEIEKMTSAEICAYLTDITQTKICADSKYCKQILLILSSKRLSVIVD